MKRSEAGAPIYDFITLCAYSERKGTVLCRGDIGGALISQNKLIGVASWGVDCAPGSPDGFTRITEFTSWIDDYIHYS